MTLTMTIIAAAVAATSGPWLRSRIFAHSVPYGRALRSRCPRCRTPLATGWRSRLPITGRCPLCRKRIGPAAGVVELSTAAVAAIITWHDYHPALLAALIWAAWHGIILSFVDATMHRLSDTLTMRTFAGVAIGLTITAAATSSWRQLLLAVAGAIAMGGIYLVIVLAKPGAMGLGDAKLALVLGLGLGWYGPGAVVTGLVAAIGIGLAAGLGLLVSRRIRSDHSFAFGPAMLLGALVAYTLAQ